MKEEGMCNKASPTLEIFGDTKDNQHKAKISSNFIYVYY